MAMIAYAYSPSRHNPHNSTVANSHHTQAPKAHIPQTGTNQTLCGKYIREQFEVDDDAQVVVCLQCNGRLRALMKKLPGCDLVRSIFGGNNLLPAGDH